MLKINNSIPSLGFGLGLRPKHYAHIFEHRPAIDWFEVISENFMDTDGRPRRNLARIREHYPVILHGVSLSIGTVDPLGSEYLTKLKVLIKWLNPPLVSDHLCWTGTAHRNLHDLLPVPYTQEALRHIVQRIRQVQDYLGRPIALENPSTYLEFTSSSMPEAEFIARMVEESGCQLLLDVNNVYVTCFNHRLDPKAYLDVLPLDRVAQIHLSGHTNKGNHIIDTHDHPVIDEVWQLYRYVVQKSGHVPNTMVEWDDNIPEFPVLHAELEKARKAAADASTPQLPQLAASGAMHIRNDSPSLEEQQQRMQSDVLTPMLAAPDTWIRPKENFTPAEQLAVYANAYRYRLTDTNAEDYPVLKHFLGDKAFHALMAGFVDEVPSQHFNIARHVVRLHGHMQSKHHSPFALELCTLETALTQLADAQETPPLLPQHVSGLTAQKLEQLTLAPRAALQLFAFAYPVNRYYCAVMKSKRPRTPKPKASYLAIFRHEDAMWRMDLKEKEHRLLCLLFGGETIGNALQQVNGVTGRHVSEWFARWLQHGLLAHTADSIHKPHAA